MLLYAYVSGNPLAMIDPLGLAWWNPWSWGCEDQKWRGRMQENEGKRLARVRDQAERGVITEQEARWQEVEGRMILDGTSEQLKLTELDGQIKTLETARDGAVEVGLAVATGGLLNAARHGAQVVDKGSDLIRAADRAEDIATSTETSRHFVQANRAAGNAARDAIAARTGGVVEQNFRVTGGLRRVDVLADGVAIESKVGRTSLTAAVRQELARDVKLLRSGQVDSVQWEFTRSAVTGKIGPTAPLRVKLGRFGIEIVE